MGSYQITCCSTADMPIAYFLERDLLYTCFYYEIDGIVYPDDLGQTMSYDAFYKKIKNGAMPVTSQVNPDQYKQFFEPVLKQGIDIIHLTLSSGISGTYNSALVAAESLRNEYPERKITIIDSLAASSGYGLLVDTAYEKQCSGMSYDDLKDWIEKNKLKLNHWFCSSDLTHFLRGGRISATSHFFGSMLNICPIMNVSNTGELIPRKKIHGKLKALKEMVRIMEETAEGGKDYSGKCILSNSACYEDARKIADIIEEKFPKLDGKVMIHTIGSTIGSHTGIGTTALFYWGAERIN